MNQITFPITRIGFVANFSKLDGSEQMEISLVMEQIQLREVLRQVAACVDGKTLAEWIEEDFDWKVYG